MPSKHRRFPIVRTVNLPISTYLKLSRAIAAEGISFSTYMRRAIENELNQTHYKRIRDHLDKYGYYETPGLFAYGERNPAPPNSNGKGNLIESKKDQTISV